MQEAGSWSEPMRPSWYPTCSFWVEEKESKSQLAPMCLAHPGRLPSTALCGDLFDQIVRIQVNVE